MHFQISFERQYEPFKSPKTLCIKGREHKSLKKSFHGHNLHRIFIQSKFGQQKFSPTLLDANILLLIRIFKLV